MTRRRKGFRFPREHGFWTMLGAVQLATLLRVGVSWATIGALSGMVVVFSIVGGATGRAIRRRPSLQIGSSALLGLSGLPIELTSGVPPTAALATAAAWIVVFTASALLVRAAFARGSRRGSHPGRYESGAVVLSTLGALGCAFAGFATEALALLISTICFSFIAGRRPTPKQVKGVGLALAGVAVLAGTFLAASAPTLLQ